MLIIRKQQVDAFLPTAEKAYVRRLAVFLQSECADSVVRWPEGECVTGKIPEETLQKFVRAGLARAQSYGFELKSSWTEFVTLMFRHAPNFDQHPLIQRTLKDSRIPLEDRLAELRSRITEQNWEAVKAMYDINAWNADPME